MQFFPFDSCKRDLPYCPYISHEPEDILTEKIAAANTLLICSLINYYFRTNRNSVILSLLTGCSLTGTKKFLTDSEFNEHFPAVLDILT